MVLQSIGSLSSIWWYFKVWPIVHSRIFRICKWMLNVLHLKNFVLKGKCENKKKRRKKMPMRWIFIDNRRALLRIKFICHNVICILSRNEMKILKNMEKNMMIVVKISIHYCQTICLSQERACDAFNTITFILLNIRPFCFIFLSVYLCYCWFRFVCADLCISIFEKIHETAGVCSHLCRSEKEVKK